MSTTGHLLVAGASEGTRCSTYIWPCRYFWPDVVVTYSPPTKKWCLVCGALDAKDIVTDSSDVKIYKSVMRTNMLTIDASHIEEVCSGKPHIPKASAKRRAAYQTTAFHICQTSNTAETCL